METAQMTQPQSPQAPQEGPVFQAPKKKRKWLKRLIILLAVLAVLFFVVIRPMLGAGQAMMSMAYLNQEAQVRDMTVSVSSTGTVTPIDSYKVTALVTGEVLSAPFEEGEQVEKGALLYQIEANDAQTAVAQAELAVRQAQLSYQNASDSINPSASGSGVVQRLYVKQGDMISAGSPIADIGDTSTMTLTAAFHSADAKNLYIGQQALVTVDGTLETLTGTIESVSGADEVGPGGALLRQVKLRVSNPGALTASTSATVTVGDIDCAAGGVFEPNLQQTIVSMAGGEVAALHVSVGSRVSYGTVLATLGGTSAGSTLENAAIALENAQLSLQRAQDAMDNYQITAPISGTVIEKNFKAGDTIENASLTAAGGNLAVIYDMSTLTFEMRIDELDINKIQVGQEVTITSDAVEGASFSGVVDKVSINGTTVSGRTTYPITVNILDPGELKPGMNVSADVIVERVGEVLSVPVEAVNRGSERPYVLVAGAKAVDKDGNLTDPTALERREVTLGRNDESYIEILDGLEAGEKVYWLNEVSNPFAMMMG
ncbi:MAG: HlyD family efflux transporter periplasmic adaptor subunit [Lawsonibacter sp.]|nr:HlyD family efflux transporter periplasmic adaptor subunit [Lawsonibacter sp.]